MHFEICVEDSSTVKLLEHLVPKFLGPQGEPHRWRLHPYKGIGRLPKDLKPTGDPNKRILLDQLPRLLRGFGKTPGVDMIVVVLDLDDRNCVGFLEELKQLADACGMESKTLFRLAVEETESWYFGDRDALKKAYPRAKDKVLDAYSQDSICGAWERLADALHPGGSAAIKKNGWPAPGQIKHEWAEKIGPLMEPNRNVSPSFGKLRDGLRRLAGAGAIDGGRTTPAPS